MTSRKIQYGVSPPKANGEVVAAMENVLETYAPPYDPRGPVRAMDEQPLQWLKETRRPIPATKAHPRRGDYEYERAGTARVFIFAEPRSGWRDVHAREQRTQVDGALAMACRLRARYAQAEKVLLVCANRNTPTMAALDEALAPEEARQLVRRLAFRYPPTHGSWLHVAEQALSSRYRQCWRDRRFGSIEELRKETAAWSQASNQQQRGVAWQFRIDDARTKRQSLYPKIQS